MEPLTFSVGYTLTAYIGSHSAFLPSHHSIVDQLQSLAGGRSALLLDHFLGLLAIVHILLVAVTLILRTGKCTTDHFRGIALVLVQVHPRWYALLLGDVDGESHVTAIFRSSIARAGTGGQYRQWIFD